MTIAYGIGLLVGSLILGIVLAASIVLRDALLPLRSSTVVLAAGLAFPLGSVLLRRDLSWVTSQWVVPPHWVAAADVRAGLLWGLLLGMGLITRVPRGVMLALIWVVLTAASPVMALVVAGLFALVRFVASSLRPVRELILRATQWRLPFRYAVSDIIAVVALSASLVVALVDLHVT